MTDRLANTLAIIAVLLLVECVVLPLKFAGARRVNRLVEHAVEHGELGHCDAAAIRRAAAMPRAHFRPLYDLIDPLEDHDPDAALAVALRWNGTNPEEGTSK